MTCSRRDHLRMIRAQQRRCDAAKRALDAIPPICWEEFEIQEDGDVELVPVPEMRAYAQAADELRKREQAYSRFEGRHGPARPPPRKWRLWEKRYVKHKQAEAVARGEKPPTYRVCQ